MKTTFLFVDGQNDFVVRKDGLNEGSLVVDGAVDDMERMTTLLRRKGKSVDQIILTMDSHQGFGIERPGWWIKALNADPAEPFTALTAHNGRVVRVDFSTGAPTLTNEEYVTAQPSYLHNGGVTGKGSYGYLKALADKNKFLIVWPRHCVVGSWGWGLYGPLSQAVTDWEVGYMRRATFITKGNNPFTEHYSAVQAEVPSQHDPGTQINVAMIQALVNSDVVYIGGEALSHCVAATVSDIADQFGNTDLISKLVLLEDCASSVTGFTAQGEEFVKTMTQRGMRVAKSTEVL